MSFFNTRCGPRGGKWGRHRVSDFKGEKKTSLGRQIHIYITIYLMCRCMNLYVHMSNSHINSHKWLHMYVYVLYTCTYIFGSFNTILYQQQQRKYCHSGRCIANSQSVTEVRNVIAFYRRCTVVEPIEKTETKYLEILLTLKTFSFD